MSPYEADKVRRAMVPPWPPARYHFYCSSAEVDGWMGVAHGLPHNSRDVLVCRIGKERLVAHLTLDITGVPYWRDTGFHPVYEVLGWRELPSPMRGA